MRLHTHDPAGSLTRQQAWRHTPASTLALLETQDLPGANGVENTMYRARVDGNMLLLGERVVGHIGPTSLEIWGDQVIYCHRGDTPSEVVGYLRPGWEIGATREDPFTDMQRYRVERGDIPSSGPPGGWLPYSYEWRCPGDKDFPVSIHPEGAEWLLRLWGCSQEEHDALETVKQLLGRPLLSGVEVAAKADPGWSGEVREVRWAGGVEILIEWKGPKWPWNYSKYYKVQKKDAVETAFIEEGRLVASPPYRDPGAEYLARLGYRAMVGGA